MYQQDSHTQKNESEFVKTHNKGRLWNILQNNGAFNSIDNSFFKRVRADFESTIQIIDRECAGKSMMEKSKQFIDSMLKIVKEYKHIHSPTPAQTIAQSTENEIPYTSEEIKQTRMNSFEKDLNKKQSEFAEFNSKPVAQNVDFSDKDDDISDDVNKLLEKAMRDRENINVPQPTTNITDSLLSPREGASEIVNLQNQLQSVPSDNQSDNQHELLSKILEKVTIIEAYITAEKALKN